LAVPDRKEETGVMAEEQLPGPAPVSPAPAVPKVAADTTLPAPMPERAGDADRDRVVMLLRDHCAEGQLSLDEFSERTGAALAARTKGELDAMLADLPDATRPVAEESRRRPRRWIVAVMSDSESKGRWRLAGHTAVVAVMGRCHIDLNRAEIEGPETVITALGIMGEIDIVAPEGIEVEVTGLSIMGRRSVAVREVPVFAGSPRNLVRAFPIMGEVRITNRPRMAGRLPEATT
jgi:hypothetical protein